MRYLGIEAYTFIILANEDLTLGIECEIVADEIPAYPARSHWELTIP